MRSSRELPALSSSAPVTIRTSRRDTGMAAALAATRIPAMSMVQADLGRLNIINLPVNCCAYPNSFPLFVDLAFLHDEPDVLQRADIRQRIAGNGDDVRRLAGGDGPEQLGMADEIRGIHGGRLNGLHRRHAVLHHEGELPGIDSVGANAGVGAEGHLHAGANRLGEVA